jgi:hypothetical protein
MAMLPNDHHPGPRCSCTACERGYPNGRRTEDGGVRLQFELPSEERAWALAQFLKRLQWTQCREIAVSDAEAYEMVYATNEIAKALQEAGFAPR